jgi:hypothetical protein
MVRWTDDGQWIYFRWKPGGLDWHEDAAFYRVPSRGGTPEQVTDAHMDSVGVFLAAGDMSRDRRWKVVSHDGDIWLIDRRRNEPGSSPTRGRRSATPSSAEMPAPSISPGATTCSPWAWSRARCGSSPTSAAARRSPRSPTRRDSGATWSPSSWSCSSTFAGRRSGARSARRCAEGARGGPARPIHVARMRTSRPHGLARGAVGPGPGRPPAVDAQQTMVPDYVTASGYTEPRSVRAKVGDEQSAARVGSSRSRRAR